MILKPSRSTPSISEFDPTIIPFQRRVLYDVRHEFDYTDGFHQLLFSGTIGSSKSLLLAHMLVTHCLLYPESRAYFGRLVLGDLKRTLLKKILDHIRPDLIEGVDFKHHKTENIITFDNKSELIYGSWHDKDFEKFRSLELSAIGIEEASENTEEYKEFFFEIIQRLDRLPHVPESWIALATNPDGPSHWIYKHFMVQKNHKRHVYYSNANENPFLKKSYIDNLKESLDPKMARRMLYGEWIEIEGECIYYNYSRDRNFVDSRYKFNPNYPVDLSFDFNIGEGKPMSALIGQHIGDKFHVAKTFIVHGSRTLNILDEMNEWGAFEITNHVRIFGDASGKNNDTRSKLTDYIIIQDFLENYENKSKEPLIVERCVKRKNPPIRKRHNQVNGVMLSESGKVRCLIYKDAEPLDEGLRLTKLKKGATYLENDDFELQHITTALGYWCNYILDEAEQGEASLV